MTTVVSRPQAAVEEHHPPTRSMGWYGMVFFIGSEAVFFANLIAAYLYVVETVASVHAPHCIAAIVLLAAQAHSHPPDQTLRVRVAVCC